MLFKEALPVTIMTTLLAPCFPRQLFADSTDNSGLVFRLNAGSCGCPFTRRLLRMQQSSLDRAGSWCIADWNNRDQHDAVHADKISKVFHERFWRSVAAPADIRHTWCMDIVLHDLDTDEIYSAVFRVPSSN